ncbi:MAG: hypothetical protein MK207_01690 [Saprospiraceae bacterium]|nr:hypothetical protein [Saprospiraceae bacterium]
MKLLTYAIIALFTILVLGCTKKNPSDVKKNNLAIIPTLETLQNDDDIIWIGEVYIDCSPNFDTYLNKDELEKVGYKDKSTYKLLKYQLSNLDSEKEYKYNNSLINKVLSNLDNLVCYKDDNLTDTYTEDELKKINSSIDTIITFDPETWAEIVQVVVNDLNPEDIKFFRTKQLLYYSKKEMMFKTKVLAIAPMQAIWKSNHIKSQFLRHEALFWLKPNVLTETPSLNHESITWATRIYRNFSLDSVEVIKGDKSFGDVLEIMMEGFRQNAGKVHVANAYDKDGNEMFEAEEIQYLGKSVDTIITFDPVDFEEIVQVVVNELEGDDIKNLRLMQDWIWNEDTKEISIVYLGFKPIIDRLDENGNFLNSGPMFTRRVGRDSQ